MFHLISPQTTSLWLMPDISVEPGQVATPAISEWISLQPDRLALNAGSLNKAFDLLVSFIDCKYVIPKHMSLFYFLRPNIVKTNIIIIYLCLHDVGIS